MPGVSPLLAAAQLFAPLGEVAKRSATPPAPGLNPPPDREVKGSQAAGSRPGTGPPDRAQTWVGRPAAGLIRRLERPLMAEVFHWTGYFPERTRWLLRNLAQRAEQGQYTYPEGRELEAGVALATFISAWAINHMQTWEGKKTLESRGSGERGNPRSPETHG
jgi:hypothetical protein